MAKKTSNARKTTANLQNFKNQNPAEIPMHCTSNNLLMHTITMSEQDMASLINQRAKFTLCFNKFIDSK